MTAHRPFEPGRCAPTHVPAGYWLSITGHERLQVHIIAQLAADKVA